MNIAALLTALARIFVIYPLVMFFWKQSNFHAHNGHVGMVRRATLFMTLFLIIMFGNLVYVNLNTAFNGVQVVGWAQWISFISSTGFAFASWHMYRVFSKLK